MMELYTAGDCVKCHRIRFILAEKVVNVKLIDVDETPGAGADLAELNPYAETPTLVDREIVLYGTWVVAEYVDERYPHPPLMPIDPLSRARLRQISYRILRDWVLPAESMMKLSGAAQEKQRKQIRESLVASDDIFGIGTFLLNPELSLADCLIAPFLWRLPRYGINIGRGSPKLLRYMERIFIRDSFRRSMMQAEREIRDK